MEEGAYHHHTLVVKELNNIKKIIADQARETMLKMELLHKQNDSIFERINKVELILNSNLATIMQEGNISEQLLLDNWEESGPDLPVLPTPIQPTTKSSPGNRSVMTSPRSTSGPVASGAAGSGGTSLLANQSINTGSTTCYPMKTKMSYSPDYDWPGIAASKAHHCGPPPVNSSSSQVAVSGSSLPLVSSAVHPLATTTANSVSQGGGGALIDVDPSKARSSPNITSLNTPSNSSIPHLLPADSPSKFRKARTSPSIPNLRAAASALPLTSSTASPAVPQQPQQQSPSLQPQQVNGWSKSGDLTSLPNQTSQSNVSCLYSCNDLNVSCDGLSDISAVIRAPSSALRRLSTSAAKQNQKQSKLSVLDAERTPSSMSQRSKQMNSSPQSPDRFEECMSQKRDADYTVFLNVGGKRFQVLWSTLAQYQMSRLGRLYECRSPTDMLEICDRYVLEDSEFFFDRSPRHFESILNLYRTGQLHLMEGVCVQAFAEELSYWGLDDLHLEPCCQYAFYRMKQYLPGDKEEEKDQEVDEFGENRFQRARKWVWELFEEPNKTKLGKIIAVISIGFVIVSTLALILSTIPAFQVTDLESNETNEHPDFSIAEAIFITWFTVEYVIRAIASPHKWQFIKEGMNVIDLLGIVPYFVSLGLSNMKSSGEYEDEMRRIAQVFRIMRILRIFRLGRHITGLQTLGATLKASYKELGLLALVVIMGMLIFSGLIFVLEKDANPDEFISMPAALYWAIITMTSVGYGDMCPRTWFGKMVGSCCAICGVLIISLPIPIIVNTFNKLYEKAKIKNQIAKKKKMAGWQEGRKGGGIHHSPSGLAAHQHQHAGQHVGKPQFRIQQHEFQDEPKQQILPDGDWKEKDQSSSQAIWTGSRNHLNKSNNHIRMHTEEKSGGTYHFLNTTEHNASDQQSTSF